MSGELPELKLDVSATAVDYDAIISDLNSSVDAVGPNISVLDDLKKRNKELANLISNYQKKAEVLNLSERFDSLKDEIDSKEDFLEQKESSISSAYTTLQDRESHLHGDLADLEHRKMILDTKERILSQGISSETNPQVISLLNIINAKLSQLSQEKSFLQSRTAVLNEEKRHIESKEEHLANLHKSSLSKKRSLEQDSLILNSELDKKRMLLQSLDQKRLDLDHLVRERTQLVQDLNKQYYTSKTELDAVKNRIASESKLVQRSKEDVESQRRDLVSERATLDEQKRLFQESMRSISEKTRLELEGQKTQFLENLKSQSLDFNEKVKTLSVKEQMLLKLESELTRREESMSETLDQLSSKSSKLSEREHIVSQKLDLASQKEEDVRAYEDEVSTLERTVFDLKSIIEQKDRDISEKEKNLHKYAKDLKLIRKSLAVEQEFLPLVNQINLHLESGSVYDAQGLYGKLHLLFKSGSASFQSSNFAVLQDIHSRISKHLKSKIVTRG